MSRWADPRFWTHLVFIWLVTTFGIALAIAILYRGEMTRAAGVAALIGEQLTAAGLAYLYASRRWFAHAAELRHGVDVNSDVTIATSMRSGGDDSGRGSP